MITTTLRRMSTYFSSYQDEWKKLLNELGKSDVDDDPLPFSRIVEINGLEYAIWGCRAEPQHAKEWRLFAIWCARQVQHLLLDKRSILALDVAEAYANGIATIDELRADGAEAWRATQDATNGTAQDTASEAAWDTTWPEVENAIWAASRDAVWAAVKHAIENNVSRFAVENLAWAAQEREFLRIVG